MEDLLLLPPDWLRTPDPVGEQPACRAHPPVIGGEISVREEGGGLILRSSNETAQTSLLLLSVSCRHRSECFTHGSGPAGRSSAADSEPLDDG